MVGFRSACVIVLVAMWMLLSTRQSSAADDKPLPAVETGSPALLGTNGLTLTGRVQPHGLPTTYYFEHGPTSSYGTRTDAEAIPPKLAAYYRETWDEGWNGWRTWDPKQQHFPDGGAAKGHIRYSSIARDDHNHDDGIGTVHLSKYMYPGRFAPVPSAYLAAGDPDFRDARIKLAVRGVDWQPHGTELMWWSQSQSNMDLNPDEKTLHPKYIHANWCYTGVNLTDLLQSGEWERADYRLSNNPHDWSYCGNNERRQDYLYWPINDTQRHLNLDYFHMVVFVNPQDRPTGSMDFDEFEVAYRNYSLAYPSNGGKLIASPGGSDDNPAALSDGWRNGPDHMWRSGKNPQAPQEFIYELARTVQITAVQIHQHTQWPSRAVEVLVTSDGQTWQALLQGELPEKHVEGPNYAFLLKRKLDATARQVKVRILSGHRPEHWGLGEIEIFGTGAEAEMLTDDDWYNVNLDIGQLSPGATHHYRLVAKNAAGQVLGPDQSFTLPANARPQVLPSPASRIGRDSAKVEGRLNPLGYKTMFHFEYGPTQDYGQQTAPQYGGRQITPRAAFATLAGLKPGTLYHYRLVASNEIGESRSADATFETAKE